MNLGFQVPIFNELSACRRC